MPEPDYYRILHVDPGAPEEIIRASYLTMMKRLKNHPDLGGDHRQAVLINKAYKVLTDRRSRTEYDQRRGVEPREDANRPGKAGRVPSSDALSPLPDCLFCGASVESPTVSEDSLCHHCGSPLVPVQRDRLDVPGSRAISRFPKRQEVTFATRPGQRERYAGESLDISPQGMQLMTRHRLRPKQVIQVDCAVCCAVARVAYVSRSEDFHIAGVQFLSRQFKRKLGNLVSTRL